MSEKHRVAVVVFCEVDTETLEDAEIVAALAVRRKLAGHGSLAPLPADISTDAYRHHFPILAVRVMEAGIAAGNGYLWTHPTSKAFLEGRR